MRRGVTSRLASFPLRIRLARPHERLELEELQRRASLALPEYSSQLMAYPGAIHLPLEQLERGDVWVAEAAGDIVGFVAIDGTQLDGLFVEPAHWRKGVGSALVDAAVHEARRRGVSLTVTAAPAARGFYESCGFAVEGEAQTRFGPALRMSR
jgi:GNAT superfamily N-acetyltransferase